MIGLNVCCMGQDFLIFLLTNFEIVCTSVCVYGLAVINRPDRLLSCDTRGTGEEDGFQDFSALHSCT